MRLYDAHRILISFAIGLGVVLLVYGVFQYRRAGDASALEMGLLGAIACAALALYLRWFLRKRR
jgi:hypothetical protein